MRIEFYDAMLSDDGRTMLVKEKAAGYGAGKLTGISLLDLIIMGGDSFYSFREQGML